MFTLTLTQTRREFKLTGGSPKGGDRHQLLARSIPGCRRNLILGQSEATYLAPITRASCWFISRIPDMRVEDSAAAQILMAQGALLGGVHRGLNLKKATMGDRAFLHQEQALEALKAMNWRGLLADDMGLGKTRVAILAWERSRFPRAMVITPVSVKYNWRREIGKVWPAMEPLVRIIDGTQEARADQIADLRGQLDKDPNVAGAVIINYDLLLHLTEIQAEILKAWVDGQLLILDEAHYVKGKDSKRTIKAMQFINARGRLLLTGTPICNLADDLYSQLSFIDPNLWKSYWEFESRYLQIGNMLVPSGKTDGDGNAVRIKRRKVVRVVNEDHLNQVVNLYKIQRKKEDVLTLPPKIHQVLEMDLDEDSQRIYQAMKQWWLYTFAGIPDDEPLFSPKAKSALESALRLEQICQGFIGGIPPEVMSKLGKKEREGMAKIPGREGELILTRSAKLVWLQEHVESLWIAGKRVVVFFRFNAPLHYLAHLYGEDAKAMHGAVSAKEKDTLADSFQEGQGRVFLCQLKMAEGFNLTNCQDVAFFGRLWTPFKNFQAQDRCHRIGQKGTVNIRIPVMVNTIEQYVHKRLEEKAHSAEVVLAPMTMGEFREAI